MSTFKNRLLAMTAAGCLLATGVPIVDADDSVPPQEASAERQRIGLSTTYPTEYADWENGFMTGNGKMGIIVFGNPLDDTIVYCDRGFNRAADVNTPTRTFNEMSQEVLDAIKKACVEEDWETANTLANQNGWKNGGEQNRHPGYKMEIVIPEQGDVTDYSRVCDYTTGEIKVNWHDDRGDWTRTSFVSRADNAVVQQLTAPTEGKLTCSITLGIDLDMHMFGGMTFDQKNTTTHLDFRAKYGTNTNDAGYQGVTRVAVTGGSVRLDGDTLVVENADEVLLLTQTEKYYGDSTGEFEKGEIAARLDTLSTDYDTLLERHAAIHTEIYNRVSVDYGATEAERAMTNEALLALQKTTDQPVKALYERIFDAGRFYFLCSGYEYAVSDLCGVWTGDTSAGWGGYYHLDANLNLQIAGGVIGDMPEVMEGYFYLNEAWEEGFQTNASKLLGCRGLLAAGNTPGATSGLISSIADYFYPYQYVTGEESWLLYPFWEYYQVTGDLDFVENRMYPLLRQMGDFYEDFLTETTEDGTYIFAGSISPENQPAGLHMSLVNNSTFDIAGGRFALETLIKVCDLLGKEQGEDGGVARWTEMLAHFPEYRINEDGALAEWAWEGLADTYGHRHASHLVTVWPYRMITPESDSELFDAATVALHKKGAPGTGHGILHAALIAAGIKDSEGVGSRLHELITTDFYYDGLTSSHNANHGIFCTDTVHAVPGIMMEMLISSDEGVLEFLPALPDGLEQGSISGVKGRNRTTIEDLEWDTDARKVTATIRSDIDQTLTLIERQGIARVETDAPLKRSPLGRIARQVTLKAGESATVTFYLDEPQEEEAEVNLALGKTAVSSSDDNDARTADKAVDGSSTTRWASRSVDDSWIYVDLGSTYDFERIELEWEAAYAKSYKLQVSDDAVHWTDIYETADGRGYTEVIDVNATGRYVRMQGLERVPINGVKYGYSLYEIRIYALPSWKENLALGKMVTASADDRINTPDRAADGALSTGWVSGVNDGAWLCVDLGDVCDIASVDLAWGGAYAENYTLQISDDAENWIDLYETADGQGGREVIEVTGKGRYVKLLCSGYAGLDGYSLNEFRVYPSDPASIVGPSLGDVDGNGKVEAADALLALQAATNKITLDDVAADVADIEGDGFITASDALSILQYATQKITGFY